MEQKKEKKDQEREKRETPGNEPFIHSGRAQGIKRSRGSWLKRTGFIFGCPLFFLFTAIPAHSNNLVVRNVSVEKRDLSSESMAVKFDISWDNSWRNSLNHDAVWVFLKYYRGDGKGWGHATLRSHGKDPAGTFKGSNSGVEIVVPVDRKGGFIRRRFGGAGRVESEGVEFTWNWGEDGLKPSEKTRIKVIGIEMVYIPEGPFYLGDGDGEEASRYAFRVPGQSNIPVRIFEEEVLVTCDPSENDDIDDQPITVTGGRGVSGNPDFPTGYEAFYIMKYEITEGQWVDFFNTLTPEQKASRNITDQSGKNGNEIKDRNTVSVHGGIASSLRPDRACGYLSWMDVSAYAAWASLRPMTELEFEKAARGADVHPFKGEYAWGSLFIEKAVTISGFEGGAETVIDENANASFGEVSFSGGDGGSGPLRAGIFATGTSTREQAGAGYYGNMEMSGNLWERVVTAGNPSGRGFKGTHGNGILSAYTGYEGNATNTDWPGFVSGQGVSGALGSGFRGGSWMVAEPSSLSVSDRSRAASNSPARLPDSGGRLVRTDPGI